MKKFISRKLLAAIAGVIVVGMTTAGVDEAVAVQTAGLITAIVTAYILGQSAVDSRSTD